MVDEVETGCANPGRRSPSSADHPPPRSDECGIAAVDHFSIDRVHQSQMTKENKMSVEGKVKEGAGFVKEELYEHGKDPESKKKAQEGRDLRNEGRVEDGKAPKTTPPGSGHPEK